MLMNVSQRARAHMNLQIGLEAEDACRSGNHIVQQSQVVNFLTAC
jgi:hypothetical protein